MTTYKDLCEEVLMCFEKTGEDEWELSEWDIDGYQPNEHVIPGRDLQEILDDIERYLQYDEDEEEIAGHVGKVVGFGVEE